MITKQQMLDAINRLIKACEQIHSKFLQDFVTCSGDFVAWLQAVESMVETIFGNDSEALLSFRSIDFLPLPSNKDDTEPARLVWFDCGLRYAQAKLIGFRNSVERFAAEKQTRSNSYILISHGGPTRSHVDATKELLETLGLLPVVVADLPNLSMSINEKNHYYMNICTGAIVLATVEDETVAQEKGTRPDLEKEVEALQVSQNIANRIIYLKEEGVQFLSKYKKKVWIPFNKDYVEASYIKTIKELRSFGLLR